MIGVSRNKRDCVSQPENRATVRSHLNHYILLQDFLASPLDPPVSVIALNDLIPDFLFDPVFLGLSDPYFPLIVFVTLGGMAVLLFLLGALQLHLPVHLKNHLIFRV